MSRNRMRYNFIILLSSFLTDAPCYAQQTVAEITSVEGQVFIKKKGNAKWEGLATIWALNEGDSVKTGENSHLTFFYLTGQDIQLGGQDSCIVRAPNQPKPFSERVVGLWQSIINTATQPKHGIRGSDKPPVLIYPLSGKLLSNTPAFAWLASAPGEVYWIKLHKDNGSVVWKKTMPDTIFNYPTDTPPLSDGKKYRLEIGRETRDSWEDRRFFTIASAEEKKKIQVLWQEIQKTYPPQYPNDVTAAIVYATVLLQEHFYTEARHIVQQALQLQPNNAKLRSMLNHIYYTAGSDVLVAPAPKP